MIDNKFVHLPCAICGKPSDEFVPTIGFRCDAHRQVREPEFQFGVYRHYKGPHYLALFTVENSTNDAEGRSTQEPMVVYISLDDGPHRGQRCARTLKQWNELVNGVPRFTYVGGHDDWREREASKDSDRRSGSRPSVGGRGHSP